MTSQTAGQYSPSSGWKVTGQTPATRTGPDGKFTSGVDVAFTTGSGVTSSVFIPDALFNAEYVRRALAEKAATVDAVAALHSA